MKAFRLSATGLLVGGQLATPTYQDACVSHGILKKYLSNTNMLISEVIIKTCKEKINIKDLQETAQCLFRANNILAFGLIKDLW